MTTTTTNPYLVVLFQRNDENEITTARRRFADEADGEQFATVLLGADAPDGIIIAASLFFVKEDGTMDLLNEWEF